jgi:hypothetical protein
VRSADASWANPKVLSIFALIFLCGVGAGAIATRTYLHARLFAPVESPFVLEAAKQVGLERLKHELKLTEVQAQTVAKVLDDYGKFYQNIEDEREDVAEYGKRRILDVLTPDQQHQFNEIFSKPLPKASGKPPDAANPR